jgi:hypothetical protein
VASFDDLANDVAALESRVSEMIFETVREQLRGDATGAQQLERQLARVRRSLVKAEVVLRSLGSD